ncbi:MAG: pyridoxal phosphate-dependent aminotransferase [Planctomycetota bacterium]
MPQSHRIKNVQSPIIPVVGELIRSNPGTISLGQGVVYYGPPPEVRDYIDNFLSDPENHKYKLVQGISELHEEIVKKSSDYNGIEIDAGHRIVVTAGGNMGFVNAILAIADPGDEIILQVPYYFNHEMAVAIANCKAVCVPTDENYQLQPGAIKAAITDKTRAVVTISPNNPTGAVYPESALRQVNDICREHGVYHISDEAYDYFTFDGAKHFSPGSIQDSTEHTIGLFSLSKSYGFASWRIGWMVIPEHLYMPVKKVQDTILICPPLVSQWAAVGAMRAGYDYCRQRIDVIAEIRRIVLDELGEIEDIVTVPMAKGAFYFLLRVHSEMDPMELAKRLIQEHKVAVIPGMTFGIEQGCYLRVACGALEKETVAEGVSRLVRGLKQIVH